MHSAGAEVMIFKIISPAKNWHNLSFLNQNKAKFGKKYHNIVFLRQTPSFSQKIVKNRRKLLPLHWPLMNESVCIRK
jgi:hypothetical protein